MGKKCGGGRKKNAQHKHQKKEDSTAKPALEPVAEQPVTDQPGTDQPVAEQPESDKACNNDGVTLKGKTEEIVGNNSTPPAVGSSKNVKQNEQIEAKCVEGNKTTDGKIAPIEKQVATGEVKGAEEKNETGKKPKKGLLETPPRRLDFYPFAYALYNSELPTHCWYCLDDPPNLRRCTGCGHGLFCDERCQTLGWSDHRAECKGLKDCAEVPDIEVRLLGRIVLRFKAIKMHKDKQDPNFYLNRTSKRSLMDIWAHVHDIKNDSFAMKKFNGIFERLVKFYGKKHLLSKADVFELHCRNYINRHAISDKAYLREIGKGLYLDLCAYDHSCRPNAVYTCKGFIATLRALDNNTNLLDRSTTFYSYIELLSTTQQRRKLLKDTWYFDCNCSRCTSPEDGILTSMNCPSCLEQPLQIFGVVPYKDPQTQVITCPKCHRRLSQGKVLEAIQAMRFIDHVVEKQEIDQMSKEQAYEFLCELRGRYRKLLPSINIYYCKIIQLLIPLVDPSYYRRLLDLHLQSEECVRFCFPPNHPAVAFHLKNIGFFFLRDGSPHRAQLYLRMARDILYYTLDKDHPLSIENDSVLEEASRGVAEASRIMELQHEKFQLEMAEIRKMASSMDPPRPNRNGSETPEGKTVSGNASETLAGDSQADATEVGSGNLSGSLTTKVEAGGRTNGFLGDEEAIVGEKNGEAGEKGIEQLVGTEVAVPVETGVNDIKKQEEEEDDDLPLLVE